MSRARLAAAAAASCLAAACGQQEPKADPAPAAVAAAPGTLAGFGWLAELAGSCWSGVRSDGITTDTQCYLPQYGQLLRGSFKAQVSGNPAPIFEGDAIFAPYPGDPKKVVYTQWGTGGGYATGEMTIEGETLVFHSRNPDGEPWAVRHVWRRNGPDGYRVTRERKEDSRWVEVMKVEYTRIPGR